MMVLLATACGMGKFCCLWEENDFKCFRFKGQIRRGRANLAYSSGPLMVSYPVLSYILFPETTDRCMIWLPNLKRATCLSVSWVSSGSWWAIQEGPSESHLQSRPMYTTITSGEILKKMMEVTSFDGIIIFPILLVFNNKILAYAILSCFSTRPLRSFLAR